jgi:hypothetical protein
MIAHSGARCSGDDERDEERLQKILILNGAARTPMLQDFPAEGPAEGYVVYAIRAAPGCGR